MATIPAATDRLTEAVVAELKEAGLDQIAFWLDFPGAALHDGFRLAAGAFARMLAAADGRASSDCRCRSTPPSAARPPSLAELGHFVGNLGIVFWEVFFLVPMGRGTCCAA